MKLSYIKFYTDPNNGNCKKEPTETIYWGNSYYRNIRVWDLLNTDILVVQAFNIKYYEYDESNYPTTLIIFYPLTVKYNDKNNIKDIISEQNIQVTHSYTFNFDTTDNFLFYNYNTNFEGVLLMKVIVLVQLMKTKIYLMEFVIKVVKDVLLIQ